MTVPANRERGQAAVEAALTLPLTVFLILGALQLFMLIQARIMASCSSVSVPTGGIRFAVVSVKRV